MTIFRSAWISLLFAMLLAGCTKPQEPGASPGAPATSASQEAGGPATEAPPPSTPALLVYNAYTSNTINQNAEAGEPTRVFKSNEKVYVGVVLHGEAASAGIKVEWFSGDEKVLGAEEVAVPVKTATVATVELSRAAPLVPGTYKALVYLNGAPSWELFFDVSL
jgi:hypothetical protein